VLHLLDEKIITKMQHYEWGDSVFVIYVALNEAIHYKSGVNAGHSAHVHFSAPVLDSLAEVYYECRGGNLPLAPLIVSWNDSIIDPTRAPQGKHLMKFVILNVPYEIKGDATGKIPQRTWETAREPYADYLIDLINEHYIPYLKSKILKRVAHSPIDIEKKIISAVHGTLGHGAFVPYQMNSMRPIPELGEYKTPLANVYLCGSGNHPGPGVSMAAGRNAAQIICQDLNISFK
jgi:beta-carotene ketolase (CrtO type)